MITKNCFNCGKEIVRESHEIARSARDGFKHFFCSHACVASHYASFIKGVARKKTIENILGKRRGKIIAVKVAGSFIKGRGTPILCKCDCGNTLIVFSNKFPRLKGTLGCGCAKGYYFRSINKKGKASPRWNGVGEISGGYWSQVKYAAKVRNLPFSIDKQYAWGLFVSQNGWCALSGLPLVFPKDHRDNTQTASLDRINSEMGYVAGNVQWIHKDINNCRWALDNSQFIEYCKLIAAYNS